MKTVKANKKWRVSRALAAEKVNDYTETIKYKLDTEALPEKSVLEKAYKTVSLTGTGSLSYLLATFHALGFRLFGSVNEATRFYNRDVFENEDWQHYLKTQYSDEIIINAEQLIAWFTSSKRIDFEKEALQARLYRDFTSKRYDSEKANEAIENLVNEITDDLLIHFDSFAAMQANPAETLSWLDTFFPQSPCTLVAQYLAIKELPAPSPVCFDKNSEYFNIFEVPESQIWQRVIALKLQQLNTDSPNFGQLPATQQNNQLKNSILTPNGNALSWLFGKGLKDLQAMSIEAINENFLENADLPRATLLKQSIDSIGASPFKGSWNEFRSTISGFLGSAISNYFSRVNQITQQLNDFPSQFELPSALAEDESQRLFHNTEMDYETLANKIHSALAQKKQMQSLCFSLTGYSQLPTEAEMQSFELFCHDIDAIYRVLSHLNKLIAIQLKRKLPSNVSEHLKRCICEIPHWLKTIDKLNELSPQFLDPSEYTKQFNDNLNGTITKFKESAEVLIEWSNKAKYYRDPAEHFADLALRQWAESDRTNKPSKAQIKANVACESLINLAKRLSSDGEKLLIDVMWEYHPTPNKRVLRRAAQAGNLVFYKSPYNRSTHIKKDALTTFETKFIFEILSNVKEVLTHRLITNNSDDIRDYLLVDMEIVRYRLHGLPDPIPAAILRPLVESVSLSHKLNNALNKDMVSIGDTLSILNVMYGQFNALLGQLSNKQKVRRMVFSRTAGNQLICVAKQNRPYLQDKLTIGKEPLNATTAEEAFQEIIQDRGVKKVSDCFENKLLERIAHQWYIDLNFNHGHEEMQCTGVHYSKHKLKMVKKIGYPARLINKTQHIKLLDHLLTDPLISVGDWSLIIEDNFAQGLQWDSANSCPKIRLEPTVTECFVSVPFTYTMEKQTSEPLTISTLAGFDLDQRGVGYAIKDLASSDIIAAGWLAVPSAKRLLKSVKTHRRKKMPKQNMQSNYSKYQANLRDKVIGDFRAQIDTICAKYDAWPILESHFKEQSSHSRNLGIVFEEVVQYYTYDSQKSKQSKRKHYWRGSQAWETHLNEVNQETGEVKRFKLYPGRGKAPHRTSTTCNCCGRNALTSLFDSIDSKEKVTVKNSTVKLNTGTIKLVVNFDLAKDKEGQLKERKAYAGKHQTMPYKYTVNNGDHQFDFIKNLLVTQLRRPEAFFNKNKGMFANFHCPFEDCGHTESSATNSAKNIVEDFYSRKIEN